MKALQLLLRYADNPRYDTHPPQEFIEAMGIGRKSMEFIRYGWRLFQEKKAPISFLDIKAYVAAKKRGAPKPEEAGLVFGSVKNHFFDSGAFSHWSKAERYAKVHKTDQWAYYDSPEFYLYLDDYAEFVLTYPEAIDTYANVDVIPNAELTWKTQQYLEKMWGLYPVPVVHYKTSLDWLQHYIDLGYPIIGLGGLVGSTTQDSCKNWIDRCFELVCKTADGVPCVKLHGFGVTSLDLLRRYPWYSVDSTSWIQIGGFGGILLPQKRNGQFVFDCQPHLIKISLDSPDRKSFGKHYISMTALEKAQVQEWLDMVGVKLGKSDANGHVLEYGVINRHAERKIVCMHYFELVRKSLPDWPWSFKTAKVKGLFPI